ncbi:4Fe-4S dicluster domain-containing protein [Acetohalobium arabaticum]|uniref:Ferredoxin n=1 Tax=Acetohalobium arabaticum (strain ATCC 49924 / DSM 5501 / Z-7288) TaxID=574087 RepID=D9QPR4_ACEAZ|nr:4Fe-4S dicluster domain-containing protein [Acetohalobium arabaticum]ADL12505.1 4Fe-4S ferredoxin iron-sulfur binding domain protein [Acetohalobium arabaticum DSM 5501]
MNKILMIDPDKCSSCKNCELICSFYHEQEFNPAKSRVQALTWERIGVGIPMMCMHCEDAACMEVCPVDAIYRDVETGAVLVDHDRCFGCKLCVSACPFGNVTYNLETKQVIKCDLCGGEPQCVEFCPSNAIEYKEDSSINRNKKLAVAEKFKDLFEEVE